MKLFAVTGHLMVDAVGAFFSPINSKSYKTVLLTSAAFDTSTEYLFQVLNWRKLESQRQIQKACMVYKSLNGLAPDYL